VAGHPVYADLVVDASGGAGKLTRTFRGPAEGGDCGIAYVSRQHQLLPGAPNGPINAPFGVVAIYPGYQAVVFIHDNRTFFTLIARAVRWRPCASRRCSKPPVERSLPLRHGPSRTGPDRSPGSCPAGGCTTPTGAARRHRSDRPRWVDLRWGRRVHYQPSIGRGVATSLMQAQRLIDLLGDHRRDFTSCSLEFDHWCEKTSSRGSATTCIGTPN
jgi:hypothetical protein